MCQQPSHGHSVSLIVVLRSDSLRIVFSVDVSSISSLPSGTHFKGVLGAPHQLAAVRGVGVGVV